jgi:hypothetical protein
VEIRPVGDVSGFMSDQSETVYVFRSTNIIPGGNTTVCAAPLELVVDVYGGGGQNSSDGLAAVFGGAVFFRNEESSSAHLGVWGGRNASRFRTALCTHKALKLVYAAPPARLVWRAVRPKFSSSG